MYKNEQKLPRQQFNCKKDKNKRRNTITTTRCLNIKSNKLWIWVNLHVLGINLEPGSVFDVFVMQAKVAERTIQFQGVLWDSAITSLSSSFRWWHRPLSCAKGKAMRCIGSIPLLPLCLFDRLIPYVWLSQWWNLTNFVCKVMTLVTWIGWLLPRLPSRGTKAGGFVFKTTYPQFVLRISARSFSHFLSP